MPKANSYTARPGLVGWLDRILGRRPPASEAEWDQFLQTTGAHFAAMEAEIRRLRSELAGVRASYARIQWWVDAQDLHKIQTVKVADIQRSAPYQLELDHMGVS